MAMRIIWNHTRNQKSMIPDDLERHEYDSGWRVSLNSSQWVWLVMPMSMIPDAKSMIPDVKSSMCFAY